MVDLHYETALSGGLARLSDIDLPHGLSAHRCVLENTCELLADARDTCREVKRARDASGAGATVSRAKVDMSNDSPTATKAAWEAVLCIAYNRDSLRGGADADVTTSLDDDEKAYLAHLCTRDVVAAFQVADYLQFVPLADCLSDALLAWHVFTPAAVPRVMGLVDEFGVGLLRNLLSDIFVEGRFAKESQQVVVDRLVEKHAECCITESFKDYKHLHSRAVMKVAERLCNAKFSEKTFDSIKWGEVHRGLRKELRALPARMLTRMAPMDQHRLSKVAKAALEESADHNKQVLVKEVRKYLVGIGAWRPQQ